MSYSINREVKEKNREGKEELFIDISITDELGTYVFGHWLNPSEYILYLDGQLDAVITALLPQAKQNKIAEIAAIKWAEEHPEENEMLIN